jgi:phosphoribosylformylglycinamidine synthase subunit PurS
VEVRVELKPEVADAEAESVTKALELLGLRSLRRVRLARIFDLEFEGSDRAAAEAQAQRAVDRLLANPVIHRVRLTKVSA